MKIEEDVVAVGKAIAVLNGVIDSKAALFYMQRWYCFDNFSAFTVEMDRRIYPTAEHAYQAHKLIYTPERQDCRAMAEVIRSAPSAHEAKNLGNGPAIRPFVRGDWMEVRRGMMKTILRAKWEQHYYVRKMLRESRGLIVIENSPSDDYWGRGPHWNGENTQGQLWMEVRDETATVQI